MLRIPLIVTFLLLFNLPSYSQNIDQTNIYYRALKEYARYVERFEPGTDTLYFEELKGVTTFFPKQIDGLIITIVTAQNQTNIYAADNGSLVHRKMAPAQVRDGLIDIGLIPYQGQYSEEQGGLRLGLSKWHSIIFEYNEATKSFDYKNIENNG